MQVPFFSMFGIRIDCTLNRDAVTVIRKLIEQNRSSYICVVNVHVLMTAVRNRQFLITINDSDWNFADGMPIVWYAQKVLGLPHVQRVAGPSLMINCFDALRGARHLLYGSSPEILTRIEKSAGKEFPGINITCISPPYRQLNHYEKRDLISRINALSPDIIWVALGAPKQETWMREFRNHLHRGVMVGVGAAFDYYAGSIKRPPVWLRRIGLEWLCRLIQDPARLINRYMITNNLFIFYLAREILFKNKLKSKGKT